MNRLTILSLFLTTALFAGEVAPPPLSASSAMVPPPCGPFPAKEDGVLTPKGDYRLVRLILEKGWIGGKDVPLVLGLRDNQAVTAWFVTTPTPGRWLWIRQLTMKLEGTSLKGDILSGAAEGEIRFEYTIDAKIEGDRIVGVFTGKCSSNGKVESVNGKLQGTIRNEDWMKKDQGLPAGKNWPSWYGESYALRGPDCGAQMIEDLSQARPIWKSEEIAGPAFGCAPDLRYGPPYCLQSNIGSGASSPVVYNGLVYWYFYVPNGEVAAKNDSMDRWRADWAQKNPDQPFPSKTVDFHRPFADDVIVAMDATTGKTVWKSTFAKRGRNIQTHKWRGFNPTPCVQDGIVYVGTYASCFYALDAKTGKVLWEFNGVNVKAGSPASVGPVMAGDVLVVAGAKVAGLDPKSGKPRWTSDVNAAGPLLPHHDGNGALVLVVTGAADRTNKEFPTQVVALDTASGAVRWKTPVKFSNSDWHPLADSGYVVGWSGVSAGAGVAKVTGTLYCYKISPAGLELAWEGPGPNPVDDYYAMCIADGVLYVAGYNQCWSMDLASGKRLGAVDEVGGKSTLNLSYADGRLILSPEGRHGGQGFAMVDVRNPAAMKKLVSPAMAEQSLVHIKGVWLPPHPHTTAYANQPLSYPLVDGRLFVRGSDAVYCYDLRKEKQ